MFGPIEQGQCAVMDGCFIQYQGGFETSYAGSMTNNFRLVSSASGDPVSSPGGDAHYDSTYAYNVHQSNSETNFFYSNAESQSQEIFMNVVNNIGLPATNGDESAALCALISRPDLATMYRFVVEHNTKFCHRQPLLFQEAELTGDFLSVRSNLGWNTGSNSLNTATAVGVPLLSSYLVQQAQNQGYTWMLDAGYSSVYDYNGWHNLRTVTAGTFTTPTFPVPTIPGATNHTDGTVYFTPMSGGSAPGTHDVVNVDPSFVDSTRNLQSWAVHKGYASSGDSDAVKTAAALAAIQANLTLTATDLLPWVRAGFKPTSGSYLNAGHDGEDIGCIVAGGITCLVSPYSPPSLPTNHSGNLTLWLVGTGTNWTGSPFGISGVVGCMLVSQTIYTPTVATITVTTGSTSGTLSITDGTFTTAVPVADPTLEVRPAQLTAGSGPVAIGLKGTNTAWYQETTAPLFTVTGGTGASLSAIVVTYSNGWATATLDPGSAAGTLTIHDAVSGTTATILVGSDAPTLVVSPTHDGIVDGGTTNITLTGTHTNWTTYNLTVPLFLSGAEFNGGTPIYNIIIISDTSATATIGHVTQTGVTTIVDQSTNASHSFTIDAAGVATTYTLSGPTSGVVSVASTNFTVTPDGTTSGTVTLHTTGSGTFLPGSTLTWTGDSLPKSFTYTPSSISGSPHSISITSSPVLIYTGSPISYTVNPASATSYTLTAPSPSEGQVGVASGNFIVQCDSSPASPVTITPNDGGNGGTFSPSSLLVSDSSTHAFTYTAASFGIKTISCTNNGGLTNPVSVDFQSYLLTVSPRSVAVDNGTVVSITATLFS
jgi:hypothetical protein